MQTLATPHVVKSNHLIEASYKLTLIEQRLILYAVSHARELQLGLSPDKPLRIEARSFAERFPDMDVQSVYRELSSAVDRLFDREVQFRHIDDVTGLPAFTRARWISIASYIDGAGTVSLIFSPAVIPYLIRLEKRFTTYKLEEISRMTSTHAIRLYELLVQFKSTGWREFTVDEFRELMGIERHEYKLMQNFKTRVLKLAVTQINELTDYEVKVVDLRHGRKVTGFRFFFGERQQQELPL
jgi:plasmid replication initiation protein